MDVAIQKSNDYLDTLSRDMETIRLYQVREMALFDYKSSIANAKIKVKIEEKIEIARNLLDILSVEDIAKKTNPPIIEVQKLKEEYGNLIK